MEASWATVGGVAQGGLRPSVESSIWKARDHDWRVFGLGNMGPGISLQAAGRIPVEKGAELH